MALAARARRRAAPVDQLVVAAAARGERAPSPDLATAVVAHARRRQAGLLLLLASGLAAVGLRVSDLASGEPGAGSAFDVAVIAGWVVAAAFLARDVVRARRAIMRNR